MELLYECRGRAVADDMANQFAEAAGRLVELGKAVTQQHKAEWEAVNNRLKKAALEDRASVSQQQPAVGGGWQLKAEQVDMGKRWKRIGRGATEDIYRATYGGVAVAVKILERQAMGKGAQQVFVQECELLHHYRHPNIYHFYGGASGEWGRRR